MAKYRGKLPQLGDGIFLTDSGLETTLIFSEGVELPEFAAFVLLQDAEGRERLQRYYRQHMAIAQEAHAGFVAEAVTWRANPDWGRKLGYDHDGLDRVNRDAIAMLADLRPDYEAQVGAPFVISGSIGPRGDGYDPSELMEPDEAERYHADQISMFVDTKADLVSAWTMTHAGEAIGITRAAQRLGMPVVISFTLETDGALPSGMSLGTAINEVDSETGAGPAYYMINCAHPSHFESVLDPGQAWVGRIRGIRANASSKSHAELNDSEVLDSGDPVELGGQYASLLARFPHFTVLGGCCGTDDRHVAAISTACIPLPAGGR
jgi:homocysteine S-methyltransferase